MANCRLPLLILAFGATLTLAGCDTFGLGGIGSSASTTPAARPIDYRHDDLAATIFALALPDGVQPDVAGLTSHLDIESGRLSRSVKATLVPADGDGVDAGLPPPASGYTYYLFGFGDRDKAAMAAAEHWQASLPSEPVISFNVTPAVCRRGGASLAGATFTIVPALPGGPPLTPLVDHAPLARLGAIPACHG